MEDVHITLDVDHIGRVTVEAATAEGALAVIEALPLADIHKDAVITWRDKDTRKLYEASSIPINPPKYSPGKNWSDHPYTTDGGHPRRLFPRASRNISQIQGIRGTCTNADLLRLLHVLCTE